MNNHEPAIYTKNLHRVYTLGSEEVHAIDDVNLEIIPHQLTVIIGRSGAGKTTLLNLISGLDEPTSGDVWVGGHNLFMMSEPERIALRRDKIGFIFQNFGLLPLLSAEENVGIPLRMQHIPNQVRKERVAQALEWVGLDRRAKHRPYELSGGEQQRVAVARALVSRPDIVLADEPTGQLDSQTGQRVLNIMRRLVDENGITLVVVSHDPQVVDAADVVFQMDDGKLIVQ